MTKINKIERIALSGGLIGALFTNPRLALENLIEKNNAEGWNCRQIMDYSSSNFFMKVVQMAVLVCTLGLWTFGAGYLVLFEREATIAQKTAAQKTAAQEPPKSEYEKIKEIIEKGITGVYEDGNKYKLGTTLFDSLEQAQAELEKLKMQLAELEKAEKKQA
jgi:hypothetical protein